MELVTAIELIKHGVSQHSDIQNWADLGSGTGTFTHALCTALHPGSTVYAIDKNASALQSISDFLPDRHIQKITVDFTKDIPAMMPLDGILMANSLHYVRQKKDFIQKLNPRLRPAGRMIIVEYDTAMANQWVPYPIRYSALVELSREAGFRAITKIGEVPSRFRQGNMYAALLSL